MTASDAYWLTVAMVGAIAASSAFVGYRLGRIVRSAGAKHPLAHKSEV